MVAHDYTNIGSTKQQDCSQIFNWYTKDFHRRDMKLFPAEAKPPVEATVLAAPQLARTMSRRGDTPRHSQLVPCALRHENPSRALS
jgi:hypothetical protein